MSMKKRVEYLVPMGYWGTSAVLREMERMVDDLRAGFNDLVPYGSSDRTPVVDVMDEGERYVIEAEIPGMKKEEVSIDIGEDNVTIEAKREVEVEEKKEGYVRKERERMSFYRQVPLPDDADISKASAKLENGLLTIAMPKKEKLAESRRKLDIE